MDLAEHNRQLLSAYAWGAITPPSLTPVELRSITLFAQAITRHRAACAYMAAEYRDDLWEKTRKDNRDPSYAKSGWVFNRELKVLGLAERWVDGHWMVRFGCLPSDMGVTSGDRGLYLKALKGLRFPEAGLTLEIVLEAA